MADKNPNFDGFKKALIENGAEFPDSFMVNLLRIIQHMKPVSDESDKSEEKNKLANPLATKFPGLAIPNDKPPIFSSDEECEDDDKNTKRITSKDIFKDQSKAKISSNNEVDEAMAALEALAPSNSSVTNNEIEKNVKNRKHSKDLKDNKRGDSRERKHRSRSRERRSRSRDIKHNKDRSDIRGKDRRRRSKERDRRSRSRDKRSRSRDKRSRSRDRRRRSRSHQRHRSRSRDKYRRSRSRNRKSRSRSHGREERSRYRDNDYEKKPRKKSPDIEISDDPEPGKVNIIYSLI